MRKVIVIPARFASTRFPGKPLFQINGRSLLAWVIHRVQALQGEFEILVATDHKGIFSEAQSLGVKTVMTDSDLQSGTDRIAQAVERSQMNLSADDLVINVQGDEPLIQIEWLRQLASVMQVQNCNMATLAHPITSQEELENKNAVKVVVNKLQQAIYFSRFAIPHSRSEQMGILAKKHIGVYAYRYSFLKLFCQTPVSTLELAESLEQLRALDLGERILVLSVPHGIQGVDVPEDVDKIKHLLLK